MAINAFRRSTALTSWGIWTLGFLSFPLAGIAGGAIAGAVNSPLTSAIGGAVTGLVIGTGQWLASSGRLSAARWIPATTIFGTGAIGLALVQSLRRRGVGSIRVVNRSGQAAVSSDVDVVAADVSDPGRAIAAASGASVVYQVLNPPYPQWAELFPGLQAGALAAAESAGARLVSMENVYMYGRAAGRPLTEDRTYAAHTKKGRLRGAMAEDLMAAHRAGRIEVAIGRASDYFGPRGGAQSNLGDRVFRPAIAGRTASLMGDPDQPHTYTFIPDIGDGLATLGQHPDAIGEIWHLPNDPETRTTRQLVDIVFRLAGQPKTKLRALPGPLLTAVGLVNPTVRELDEMRYLFEEPFVVDSSKIRDRLGVVATPAEQALTQTLADYRASSLRVKRRPGAHSVLSTDAGRGKMRG